MKKFEKLLEIREELKKLQEQFEKFNENYPIESLTEVSDINQKKLESAKKELTDLMIIKLKLLKSYIFELEKEHPYFKKNPKRRAK